MNWRQILTTCGVQSGTTASWAPVFAEHCKPSAFSRGLDEMDDFLANVLHECGMLERLVENLNYSAKGLANTWPRRYRNADGSPNAQALALHRNPEAIANATYAGRLGNTQPGDGWKYRGRGLIQVTGRANYAALGKAMGLPLEAEPWLLEDLSTALRASIAWWERNVPDAFIGDDQKVRRAVNGGELGLDEVKRLVAVARRSMAA
jgi:putative chitinase